jgi:DNA mismatch repair protein MutL
MDADDALLALERHATSKISTAADLDHIATLGFRGEALPSMAAVSRFVLLTCADPAEGGVRVTVEGGRILGVEGAARARGTTVELRDLFFNTPARRKFLRAPSTELRHAQEAVFGSALARPDVAFILRHGGRTLLDTPKSVDPAARLRELWRRIDGPVHRFSANAGQITVWGLLARGGGSGRPGLTSIVNGRVVRDRLLVGAVRRVLRAAGAGFGGARVALFVELPSDQVDVNVHPAKAEVRFSKSGAIFALVERAVRDGISASHGRVPVDRLDAVDGVAEAPASGYGGAISGAHSAATGLFSHPAYGEQPEADGGRYRPAPEGERLHPSRASGARPGGSDTPFGRLIGQYRNSFLLLELSEAEVAALPPVQELLERAGIEVEPFGPETLRVAALPPDADLESVGRIVEELLERATAFDGVPERVTEELADELAASLSCRAAIKVNHSLTEEEQRALLRDLGEADNPYRCPHGRPIVLRLSQEEMERRLGRR